MKYLLKTELADHYAIAKRLGLKNNKVLYNFCKKHTGYSPSELKKLLRKESENDAKS